MIEVMSIVAVILGVAISAYWTRQNTIAWFFQLIHLWRFRSKDAFYVMYDEADDRVSYEWYFSNGKKLKKYSDYTRLLSNARDTAYDSFSHTHAELQKMVLLRIFPYIFAPAILFWSYWYLYVLGALGMIIIRMLYDLIVRGYRPGFYQRIAIYAVLSDYENKQVKEAR